MKGVRLILFGILIFLFSISPVMSAVGDWQMKMEIWNLNNTLTKSDDVLNYSKTITCLEGANKNTCRFGENVTKLYHDNIYYMVITINQSEPSWNYDADAQFETMIFSERNLSACNNGSWSHIPTSSPELVLNTSFIPIDDICDCDLFFTTTETCSMCNQSVNYTNDIYAFEGYGVICNSSGTDYHQVIDFSGTETASLDSDPENAGGSGIGTFPLGNADTTTWESGQYYSYGAIFTVDNNWGIGDKADYQYLRVAGELGDSTTFMGWSWIIEGTPCTENWVQYNTSCGYQCGEWDKYMKYYLDINFCGTNTSLPADNGTCYTCDYCTPTWECTQYNLPCPNQYANDILTCLNVSGNGTCCNVTNLTSDCVFSGNYSLYSAECGFVYFYLDTFFFLPIWDYIQPILVVPSYPYVDYNTNYPMEVILFLGENRTNVSNMWIDVTGTDLNVTTFNFTWNTTSESYNLVLLFTEEGNFPFNIYGSDPNQELYNVTGTLIVREPYYITVEGYETETLDSYENDFAYVLFEIKGSQNYDAILENFITPLLFSTLYDTPTFHAPYTDGSATVKLWERDIEYGIRLVDGQMTFDGTYVAPNITKTYGTNMFLESRELNGTTMTLQYLLTEREITQYRWLFNWLYIIAMGMCIVVAVFLFFIIPNYPLLSITFGVGGTIVLTLFRVTLWIWKGW